MTNFQQWSQLLGEGAFLKQLGDDLSYWAKCQERWGAGPGYKTDISHWTAMWFSGDSSKQRAEFIESELQRQWKELLKKLETLLSSAEVERANEVAGVIAGGAR